MRTGYETFQRRLEVHIALNKVIIDEKQLIQIFGSYKTIYNANQQLYSSMVALRMEGSEHLRNDLGKLFNDFVPYFKIYTTYIVKWVPFLFVRMFAGVYPRQTKTQNESTKCYGGPIEEK